MPTRLSRFSISLVAGFVAVVFIVFPMAAVQAASNLRIGQECQSNGDCISGDCESSDVVDTQTNQKKSYCDCWKDENCFIEYGPVQGGDWRCLNGATYSHDLDYCKSTTGITHYPIPPQPGDRWDALLHPQDIGATTFYSEINANKPKPAIHIPGLTFSDINTQPDINGYIYLPWIGEYITAVYRYAAAAASILAAIIIIKSGFEIVISAGGEKKADGYKHIFQAVVGLFIMWGSYAILFVINPDLVNLKGLAVKAVEGIPISSDRIGDSSEITGTTANNTPMPGGKGDVAQADGIACPALTPGTKFNGAFTTYYNLNTKRWGEAGRYKGIYKGSDPSLQGKGDFFCAVSMECGCPNRGYQSSKDCVTSKKSWAACRFFDSSAKFCEDTPGKYIPGKTVAASTCFPKGCTFKVDDTHTLRVTDRGAGIIGTHFDLYLGVEGDPNFLTDTSWLNSNNLEIVSCPGKVSQKEADYMRRSYARYKPNVCKPGVNC